MSRTWKGIDLGEYYQGYLDDGTRPPELNGHSRWKLDCHYNAVMSVRLMRKFRNRKLLPKPAPLSRADRAR